MISANKMFEKHLPKSDVLNKYTDQRATSLPKISLSHKYFFTHFVNSKKFPNFYVSGTLAMSRLITNHQLIEWWQGWVKCWEKEGVRKSHLQEYQIWNLSIFCQKGYGVRLNDDGNTSATVTNFLYLRLEFGII